MKLGLIPFCFFVLLVSCGDQQSPSPAHTAGKIPHAAVTDSNTIVQVVKDFLQWYKVNYDTLNSNPLVTLVSKGNDTRYRVNFENAVTYLKLLQSSEKLEAEFINKMNSRLQSCDSAFMYKKQNDGPPEGFEADLLLLTQEPEIFLENIENLTFNISTVNHNGRYNVQIPQVGNTLMFELSAIGNNFKITAITNTY